MSSMAGALETQVYGSPCNGIEEEWACAPERVLHRPSVEEIVHSLQTGNPWA